MVVVLNFSGQMGDTRCRHNISNYKYTKENFYDPAVNKPPLIPYYINDYRVDLSSFI
jgi:nitrate reductase cytochrome c-type subunit